MTETSQETWLLDGEVLVYDRGSVVTREAVGFANGRIVFVGAADEARARMSADAAVHDLEGRTVMPGIHDAHMHGRNRGIDGWVQVSCDLGYEGGTVDYVLGKLRDALLAEGEVAHLRSDYLFIATCLFAPALQPAGRLLTRDDLDRLSADPADDEFGTGTARPIVVYDKGVHSNFANSKAIANAGVEAMDEDPGHIGRDGDGRVNGVFNDFHGEWGPLPPVTGDEDYEQRVSDLELANSLGITSQFEAAGTVESAALWARIAKDGRLTARINQSINVTAWARGNSDPASIAAHIAAIDRVRETYDGRPADPSPGTIRMDTVKVFADGEAEYPHQTAAMLRPYNNNAGTEQHPEWRPSNRYGDDPSASDAIQSFIALDAAGWNIHVHCLGDRSTRETLDNFEAILEQNDRWDRRHTICHLTFVTKEDIARMRDLGVLANMSLQWAKRDAWSVDAYEGYIDRDLLDRAYPARELHDAGITLTGGSDWAIDPLDPWLQMQIGVTREGIVDPQRGVYPGRFAESQALTVDEALIMHTLGGAVQMHQDDTTGSIEVGKYADLIVIDRNPTRIPADEIHRTGVEATILGGRLVWGELPARAASA